MWYANNILPYFLLTLAENASELIHSVAYITVMQSEGFSISSPSNNLEQVVSLFYTSFFSSETGMRWFVFKKCFIESYRLDMLCSFPRFWLYVLPVGCMIQICLAAPFTKISKVPRLNYILNFFNFNILWSISFLQIPTFWVGCTNFYTSFGFHLGDYLELQFCHWTAICHSHQ